MSDKSMAQAARSLASHLLSYAKERREEDKKAIAVCHTELCREYRKELEEKKD